MYAIVFDMVISDLKEHYGEKYHSAYTEIKNTLSDNEFYWIQGSTSVTKKNLDAVYLAINSLSKISWLRNPFETSEFSELRTGLISH